MEYIQSISAFIVLVFWYLLTTCVGVGWVLGLTFVVSHEINSCKGHGKFADMVCLDGEFVGLALLDNDCIEQTR